MCDLAAVLEPDELELALDRAISRRAVVLGEVEMALEGLPRNSAGAGVLRALIAARPDGRARAESPLELGLHRLLRRHRIRGWTPQFEVAGCRVDVGFVKEKLALQLDSFLHHSARTDWVLDHTRNAKLVEAGWRVLPVTKEDLEQGEAFAERIRRARVATPVVVQSAV
jgi:very-short-patch-repair endonuclease